MQESEAETVQQAGESCPTAQLVMQIDAALAKQAGRAASKPITRSKAKKLQRVLGWADNMAQLSMRDSEREELKRRIACLDGQVTCTMHCRAKRIDVLPL